MTLKRKSAFIIALLTLCCSCTSNKQPLSTNTDTAKTSITPKTSEEWKELKSHWNKLPQSLRDKFDDTFFTQCEQFYNGPLGRKLKKKCMLAFATKTPSMPLFPGFPTPLKEKSPYDSYQIHYQLQAPLNPDNSKAWVLLLSEQPPTLPPLSDVWILWVPTRPHMNYQLTAEGDLWHIVDVATNLYPQLTSLPCYLIGEDNASDAALYFANHYRYRFAGVAFSGGRLGLSLPNLDSMPVVYFPSNSPTTYRFFYSKRPVAVHHRE